MVKDCSKLVLHFWIFILFLLHIHFHLVWVIYRIFYSERCSFSFWRIGAPIFQNILQQTLQATHHILNYKNIDSSDLVIYFQNQSTNFNSNIFMQLKVFTAEYYQYIIYLFSIDAYVWMWCNAWFKNSFIDITDMYN